LPRRVEHTQYSETLMVSAKNASQRAYRMPEFRERFPGVSEDEYHAIEDRLESYLLLTIRFVFEDASAGGLDLTGSHARPTIPTGSIEPFTNQTIHL